MTRAYNTATTQQNTGGAVAGVTAGKNAVINGGFDIWQRGTSFASTAGYLADRWTNSSAVSGVTVSRQSTTPADGSQYHMRLTSTGNGSYMNLYQYIETANAQTLWGKTATFSIKMRKNSTTTLTSIGYEIDKSATADAGSGATWTSLGSSSATIASMSTTTWTTYTVTVSVPNDGTANSLRIFLYMNGTETSGGYVEYSQAQLELGSVATPFSRAGGTIQGELAACQRYYWRQGGDSAFQYFGRGVMTSTTNASIVIQNPVVMRIAPTAVDVVGLSSMAINDQDATPTPSALTIDVTSRVLNAVNVTISSSTKYRSVTLLANGSASTSIGFTAEL
jgi:hypothetical protein